MQSKTIYLKLILLLSLIGIGVSGKLLSVHNRFSTGQASLTESCFIGESTGCASVAVSSYSDIFGVPLAAIAMGYFFTLLFLCFWALRNQQAANEPVYTGFFLSTLAVIVTVVMFVISNYVLKQFCPYCAMLWLVNLAVWPLFVKQLGLGWGNALVANLTIFGKGPIPLRKDRLLSSFGIGLACLVIFAVIGISSKNLDAPAAPADSSIIADYEKAPIVMLMADAMGGPTSKGFHSATGAPLMEIVELADFQCPACRMAAQYLKPFALKHPDDVRITFHNFPLDGSCNSHAPGGMHEMACPFAKASLCMAKQDKFWSFHDQVYDRQLEGLNKAMIHEIVEKIGGNKEQLEACLADPATETQLQKDTDLGETVDLHSTPTIIINGRKLEGARTPAELEVLYKYLKNGAKQ